MPKTITAVRELLSNQGVLCVSRRESEHFTEMSGLAEEEAITGN